MIFKYIANICCQCQARAPGIVDSVFIGVATVTIKFPVFHKHLNFNDAKVSRDCVNI